MQLTEMPAAAVPRQFRITIDKTLDADTPNVYITQKANAVLSVPIKLSPLQNYVFPNPMKFYSGTLPIKDLLGHPNTKFAIESTGALSDFGGKILATNHADTARALQGVSVFVGAYGCIDRMMKLEKYGRMRQAFCFAELALAILIFLGRFVPQLDHASMGLLGIKTLVKVGDKYVEKTYSAREPEGKLVLQMLQNPESGTANESIQKS